jgi:hypothetical protein
MIFEDALIARVKEEQSRINDVLISGVVDIRAYHRAVGGYHALRLVLEEFIPQINKERNEK